MLAFRLLYDGALDIGETAFLLIQLVATYKFLPT